ncbi:MAG: pyruvate formate lyase-activating protein [Oscillospiraceae bacterium]|nr:pyruvate formate lyase-activating protein [Oscillospiraceae bacterium]
MSRTGKIHSLQSFGAVDGPGIRFVVFLSGCPLRCGCCHNPDTWDMGSGEEMSAEEIFNKLIRYKEYFGEEGGITLSGGEPLMQTDFCIELLERCKSAGINTCIDTSGCILNDEVCRLIDLCDLVLLDIKYTNDEDYLRYAGCSYKSVLDFYDLLIQKQKPMWLRQVVLQGLNDTEQNRNELLRLKNESGGLVKKVELLPFRKICQTKYDAMGIEFRFKDIPEGKDGIKLL